MKRIVYLTEQAVKHAQEYKYELACEYLHNISTANLEGLKVLDTLIEKMNRPTDPSKGHSGGPQL